MNTFKKLMFGLLLSGMAFTAACGDDGVKPGTACKKADECGDLKCVIKNAGDKSGTCEKPCSDAAKDCKDPKKTKCDNGIEFGKTKAETKVCMAPADGGSKKLKEGGEGCLTTTDDESKQCDAGLVCATVTAMNKSFCVIKCQNPGNSSSECSTTTKEYNNCVPGQATVEGGTDPINVCYSMKAPGGGVAEGDPCEDAENKKCAEGLYCVVEGSDDAKGICRSVTPCDETACTTDAMKECQDVKVATGTAAVKVCGDKPGTAVAGGPCDNTTLATKCGPDLVCEIPADGATAGTCVATCDPTATTPCSVNTETCQDAKVLANSTPGKVCK